MQTRGKIVLIFVLILLISVFAYIQVRFITKAKWDYSGIKLKDLGLDKVTFYIFFKINNPGLLSLTISEQDYSIFLNDSYVSRVVNPDDTKIKAEGVSVIPFLIQLKPGDVVKAGVNNFSALLSKSKRSQMKIRITGKLTLKLGPVTIKRLPFDMNSTLAELTAPDPDTLKT